MVELIDKKTVKAQDQNSTLRITIPSSWTSILNIEPGEEVEVALANGKHGLHVAAWSKDKQPKIGEIEDQI